MRRIGIALVCVAAGLWFGLVPVAAETIIPSKIAYTAKMFDGAEVKLCLLTLEVRNPPDAETVEFSAVMGWDKIQQVVAGGFTFAVVDVDASEQGPQRPYIKLASAGFSSASFNSAGLVQNTDRDNVVWTWTRGADDMLAFLNAFMLGDFRLLFARAEPARLRTYQVTAAPPQHVKDSFIECAVGLTPKGGVAGTSMNADRRLEALERAASEYGATLPDFMSGVAGRMMRSTSPAAKP